MPKKLVLCLDGTSNRYCRDNTNVIKLLAMLDKRASDQLVYYQPGIGTIAPPGVFSRTWKWILTRVDLAFSNLLHYHAQDAYRFLMRYHEDGDEIYVFGFSRGAYTARVVAGMLCKVGLLARGNEELVPFAWDIYAQEANDDEASGFRDTFGRRVTVAFVGVWDTVSSVRYAGRDRHFAYTFDNPIVKKARHAIALDERRAYFRQNLLKEPARVGQDVRQVWFPGVHCDVGGGYVDAQSGLSKIALAWMVGELGADLIFNDAAFKRIVPVENANGFASPDPMAQKHESLRGWWWVGELLPKRIRDPVNYFAYRWILPLGHRRYVNDGAVVHRSVVERMQGGGGAGGGYLPPNLPKNYTVECTKPAVTRA
jgi:uncharacterized protein (DUF2235 family)